MIRLIIVVFALLSFTVTHAQFEVNGQIVDSDSGVALIGVTIVESGTQNGVISDIDGGYILNVKTKDAILEFSYLGYKSETIALNGKQKLDVLLAIEGVSFDEVVITGLGTKRQQRELGYSTEKFKGDEIALSNAPNIINALSGKSSGVQIANNNGVDGGTTRITIRGNNNIKGNNQPLIVVDGVPLENNPGLTSIGRGTDWGSAINHINPEDIQDVNILKGPTASAKYGTRGANGVILITTKRGKQENGLGIQYSVIYKSINAFRFRDVQNEFGAGGPTSLLEPSFATNVEGEFVYPTNVHTSNGPYGRPTTEQFGFYSTGVSWGPRMEGQMVRWWDGELRSYDPQPNNLKQYFGNGSSLTHNINFSTGTEKSSTRVSLTSTDHIAVVPNSNYKQYTANLGSTLNIHEKLTADIALSYINYNRKNSPSLGDDNNASFGKGILYSWPRSYKGLERELNFNEDGTRYNYDGRYPFTFTPQHLWWNTYHQNTYLTRNKIIGSIGLNFEATNWLTLSGRTGLDQNYNEFEERFDPVDISGVNEARYSNELERDRVQNTDVLITAHKQGVFDSAIDLKFSVGGTRWSRSQYGLNATAENWQNPWLFTFNNYRDLDEGNFPQEVRFDKKINSVYSFLNLGFSDFLFVELSGRNDWSSSLPLDNNSYFYPSASLSYIVTEHFDLPMPWLNFLKLRGSYAQTANDTDPFLLDFIYETGTFAGQQTANTPNVKPPVSLRPQTANSYEVGASLGMLDDRINLDFAYYYIKSFDQILDSPVPSSSGVQEVRINSGILENYGYELALKATVLQKHNFFVETGINLSHNRNFVVSLGEGAKTLELDNIWGLFGPNISVQEGEQYGTIYGYDHIYHENGSPILNDEGTHYEITENLAPIGQASPDFLGGWSLRSKYKRFTISTLVDAKIGGDVYAGSYVIGLQTGQSPETLLERNGGGLPYTDPDGNERDIGVILPGVYSNGVANDKVVHYYHKYLPNAGGWGQILTTPGIMDNTWVKMREISVGYSFPGRTLGKLFQDVDLSLVGRDLFYFYSSLPDHINPEGSNGAGNAQGLEWASYPGMRSFSVRLSVKL